MMKVLSLGVAIISTFSLTAFANTKIHLNEISFRHAQAADSSAADFFYVDQHSISSDQPTTIQDKSLLTHWFTPAGSDGNSETVFQIMAGRHKSSNVFNDITQWGYNTSGIPREINFAVEGTLRFTLSNDSTYRCKHVVLAQTGIGLSNIWYVFSLNGSGMYHGARYSNISCTNTISNLIREFRVVSDGHHSFVITPQSLDHETYQ